MTRNSTDTYLSEATRTIFETPDMPVRHYDLLGRAQTELGQAIAAAVKAGSQCIFGQIEKLWQALVNLAAPPTALANKPAERGYSQ